MTIAAGADRLGRPGERAGRRPRPGQRGDRARVRQRPHPPRAGEPRPRTSRRDRGHARTRSPGSAGWSTSGGAARSRSLSEAVGAEPHGQHRGRHDAAGRHHDRRPELGPGRRGAGPRRGLRRADRPEAVPRAPDQRRGLELAGDDPPRDPGRRLRPAGAQPARPLQHVRLALPQGRGQPAAALDPPGRDARGAAAARAPRRPAPASSSKTSAPGTTTGSRSAPGRPTTSAAASSATPTG